MSVKLDLCLMREVCRERFIESVRMMACVICVTLGGYLFYGMTSMVRLEVVTLWAPLSSCTVLPPCLTMNPQPDRSLVTEPPDHDFMWLTVGFDKHLYFCIGFVFRKGFGALVSTIVYMRWNIFLVVLELKLNL